MNEYAPINQLQHAKTGGCTLVRVDPQWRDVVMAHSWRSTRRGIVSRRVEGFDAQSKRIVYTEHLALTVLGLPPYTKWRPVNGDPFDLRRQNLTTLDAGIAAAAANGAMDVEPGSSFRALPEYAEAHKLQLEQGAKNLKLLRRGRPGRLTDAQVLGILEKVRTDGLLKGASLSFIQGFIADEHGVEMTVSQISQLIKGTSCHIDGYDYDALARSRPTRSGRAVQQWMATRDTGVLERKNK